MYHSFLIHSSADGHLGCFHVLAIINLKKLEIDLPYDPAIPLLGIHTEETRRERDTCTPMFIAALFIMTTFLMMIQKSSLNDKEKPFKELGENTKERRNSTCKNPR